LVGRLFSITWGESPYTILRDNKDFVISSFQQVLEEHYEEINLGGLGEFADCFPEHNIDPDCDSAKDIDRLIYQELDSHIRKLADADSNSATIRGTWSEMVEWFQDGWAWSDADYFDIPVEGMLPQFTKQLTHDYFDYMKRDGTLDYPFGKYIAPLRKIITEPHWYYDTVIRK